MGLDFWNAGSQGSFDLQRQAGRIEARLPLESDCQNSTCGWDPVNQAGKRMDCPTCGGRGKIISWVTYVVHGRLMWTNVLNFAYPVPTAGTALGDCIVTVSQDWTGVMDAVMENARAYLNADDRIVRPQTRQETVVAGLVKEWEYVCHLFTPGTT